MQGHSTAWQTADFHATPWLKARTSLLGFLLCASVLLVSVPSANVPGSSRLISILGSEGRSKSARLGEVSASLEKVHRRLNDEEQASRRRVDSLESKVQEAKGAILLSKLDLFTDLAGFEDANTISGTLEQGDGADTCDCDYDVEYPCQGSDPENVDQKTLGLASDDASGDKVRNSKFPGGGSGGVSKSHWGAWEPGTLIPRVGCGDTVSHAFDTEVRE